MNIRIPALFYIGLTVMVIIAIYYINAIGGQVITVINGNKSIAVTATSSDQNSKSNETNTNTATPASSTDVSVVMEKYFEVIDSCSYDYVGECVIVRDMPSLSGRVLARLRNGVILKIDETVKDNVGQDWHKVEFAHTLAYPERVADGWYVRADLVRTFLDDGDHNLKKGQKSTSTKRILVDISDQRLYAYEDDVLYMSEPVSTGLELTPTPRGTFPIYKMLPTRYMQGPIPGVSSQVYDLPGVPWDMYFTSGGAVIHGAYWHDSFGKPYSHGCVNLTPLNAKKLYEWTVIGTKVTVRD